MKTNGKTLLITGILLIAILICAGLAYKTLVKTAKNLDFTNNMQNTYELKDFTVLSSDNKIVKLSDFKEKPIIINFWASWCPPCKAELPDFDYFYNKYKDKIDFLMVNMTDGNRETVENVNDFVQKNGWSFPIYFDTERSAIYSYQISSIPVSIFISKKGQIIDYRIGMLSKEKLQSEIKQLLEEN